MSAAEPATADTLVIPAGTWKVDPVHSSVEFQVKHLGIANVKGNFKEFEGTLESGPDGVKAYGTVDVASVDTREPQRDGHLRSPDFFDADTHPQITFSSTSVRPIDEDTFEVEGDFTIRSITRPLKLVATLEGSETDPSGQAARRARGDRPDQPLGLRHEVQHGPRLGQRRRRRQGEDPHRRLRREGRLARRPARGGRRSPAVRVAPQCSAHDDLAERVVDRRERVGAQRPPPRQRRCRAPARGGSRRRSPRRRWARAAPRRARAATIVRPACSAIGRRRATASSTGRS